MGRRSAPTRPALSTRRSGYGRRMSSSSVHRLPSPASKPRGWRVPTCSPVRPCRCLPAGTTGAGSPSARTSGLLFVPSPCPKTCRLCRSRTLVRWSPASDRSDHACSPIQAHSPRCGNERSRNSAMTGSDACVGRPYRPARRSCCRSRISYRIGKTHAVAPCISRRSAPRARFSARWRGWPRSSC